MPVLEHWTGGPVGLSEGPAPWPPTLTSGRPIDWQSLRWFGDGEGASSRSGALDTSCRSLRAPSMEPRLDAPAADVAWHLLGGSRDLGPGVGGPFAGAPTRPGMSGSP